MDDAFIVALKVQMDRLEGQMDRIEGMLGLIAGHLDQQTLAHPAAAKLMERGDAQKFMRQFTLKQHCSLQLILQGASDREIAEKMGVSPNTVKQHIRAAAKKMGVGRTEMARTYELAFDTLDGKEYLQVSGGLPRSWAATWTEGDPYKALYAPKGAH